MKNLALFLILTLSACSGVDGVNGDDGTNGSDGGDGLSPRVVVSAEAPGTQCPQGGHRIDTGLDLNNDGNLAPLEIEDTVFICNGESGAQGEDGATGQDGATGADGVASLVNTSIITTSAQCAGGGVRIDTGIDDNVNGVLDPSEITATSYVCNGINGAAGNDGADGNDGTNGQSGFSSLVATDIEAAGANCSGGGVRIRTGIDSNRNNLLDSAEVQTTRYVCNGSGGAALSPVVVSAFGGYANPTYFTADQAATLISAPITVPGPGKIIATGSVDLYCDTAAGNSSTDCSSFPVQGVLALTSSAALSSFAELTAQDGHVFFIAAKDSTNNLFTTRVFNVSAAGTQTYYLRMRNDNDGEIGGWRQRLTLLWIPN